MERITRILLYAVVVLVSAFLLLSLAREATMLYNIGRTGDIWSFFHITDSVSVVSEVDSTDFLAPPYASVGDTLLTINGEKVTPESYFEFFSAETEPGREFVLTFRRPENVLEKVSEPVLGMLPVSEGLKGSVLDVFRWDQNYTTVVRTRSIPRGLLVQLSLMFLLRVSLVITFVAVGVWAFVKRPGSWGVRALLLFCLALVLNLVTGRGFLSEYYASFSIPASKYLYDYFGTFSYFFPAFWLNLQFLFPNPRRVMKRHPFAVSLFCYLPQILLIVARLFSRPEALGMRYPLIAGSAQVLLGLAMLFERFVRSSDALERRQARLVLWGAAPGLIAHTGVSWLMSDYAVMESLTVVQRLGITNMNLLILLLLPLSLVYAFGRYRLLEVQGKLKRGTAFVVVSGALLVTFAAALFGIGKLLLDYFGIESRTPTFVIGLGLALGFLPAHKKVRSAVLGAFYPERKRLRTLLQEFLQTAPSIGERRSFWSSLESRLEEGLDSSGAYPLIASPQDGMYLLEGVAGTPFDYDCDLVRHIGATDYPIMVDELVASGVALLTPEQEEWLNDRDVAVILPLPYGGHLFGFFCIGRKSGGEDFEPEELRILRSLAPQIALAGENLELIEDQLNRRRMEEQLEFARTIQESLLPGELPSSERLDLAASSRSCLEVAGDYYDVLTLQDGRIAIAIGDVAGKGAGAALLMANLQASLRTAMTVGGSLVEALSTMNRQLFDSTPSDMFASLFVGVLDPERCVLEYVNAGHNPPLLFRPDGQFRTLDTGGLILGVNRSARYEEASEQVGPGDLLVLFTDGITEAMDDDGLEFGLERLQEIVTSNPELRAEDLIRSIEQEVDTFRNGAPVTDDQTILVAKTNGLIGAGS